MARFILILHAVAAYLGCFYLLCGNYVLWGGIGSMVYDSCIDFIYNKRCPSTRLFAFLTTYLFRCENNRTQRRAMDNQMSVYFGRKAGPTNKP